ncbi:MAG: 4-(cytidine 5'-diphospho)-2-C-methyl-D-erythritol kinase [Candidatus Omnitrophota bacterium]
MIIAAPAKINLYLRVLSKREDGYHEIETLFERVSIFDNISIEPTTSSTTITCDNPNVPTDDDSLMARTIAAFLEEAGTDLHFQINLEKKIPISSGMGGGSSDAASLLKGMNALAGSPLDGDTLLRVAGKLGADVPFFIADSRFAYGKGRGDVISRVESPLEIWHVLVTPPFEARTRDIYNKVSAFSLTKDEGVDRIFSAFLNGKDISAISENLCNDLQEIALENFPILEEVFSALKKEGAKGVLLSGSGPTVFGIFDREKAEKGGKNLRSIFPEEENWKVFVARTY